MIKDIDSYYNEWLKTEICVCVDCIAIDKTDKEVLALKEANLRLENQIKSVLKDKLEFESRIKEEIKKINEKTSSSNEEKTIINFSKSILDALDNYGKSKIVFDEIEDSEKENLTVDFYRHKIVEKLIEVAKKS
jgi:hypothetical protein